MTDWKLFVLNERNKKFGLIALKFSGSKQKAFLVLHKTPIKGWIKDTNTKEDIKEEHITGNAFYVIYVDKLHKAYFVSIGT